jgi:hypothetical protein
MFPESVSGLPEESLQPTSREKSASKRTLGGKKVKKGGEEEGTPQGQSEVKLKQAFRQFLGASIPERTAQLDEIERCIKDVSAESLSGRKFVSTQKGTELTVWGNKSINKVCSSLSKIADTMKESSKANTPEREFVIRCLQMLIRVDVQQRMEHIRDLSLLYQETGRYDDLWNLLRDHVHHFPSSQQQQIGQFAQGAGAQSLSVLVANLFGAHAPVRPVQQMRAEGTPEEALDALFVAFKDASHSKKLDLLDDLKAKLTSVSASPRRTKDVSPSVKKAAIKERQAKEQTIQEEIIEEVKKLASHYLASSAMNEPDYRASVQCLQWLAEMDFDHKFTHLKTLARLYYEGGHSPEAVSLIQSNVIFTASDELVRAINGVDFQQNPMLIPEFIDRLFTNLEKQPLSVTLDVLIQPLKGKEDSPLALTGDEKKKVDALIDYLRGNRAERLFIRELKDGKTQTIRWLERISLARQQAKQCAPAIERFTKVIRESGLDVLGSTMKQTKDELSRCTTMGARLGAACKDPKMIWLQRDMYDISQEMDYLAWLMLDESNSGQKLAVEFLSGRMGNSLAKIQLRLLEMQAIIGRLERADMDKIAEISSFAATLSMSVEKVRDGVADYNVQYQKSEDYCTRRAQTNPSDAMLTDFNVLALYGSDEVVALKDILTQGNVDWGSFFEEVAKAADIVQEVQELTQALPGYSPGTILLRSETMQDRLRGRPEESLSKLPFTLPNLLDVLKVFLERRSVFCVQPFITGELQHASLAVEAGKQMDLEEGSTPGPRSVSYTDLLTNVALQPNFNAMLTPAGKEAMKVIFGELSNVEFQHILTQIYSEILTKFSTEHQGVFETIGVSQWKSFLSALGPGVLDALAPFHAAVDIAKGKPFAYKEMMQALVTLEMSRESQAVASQMWEAARVGLFGGDPKPLLPQPPPFVSGMFCSEFVATMMMIMQKEMDEHLNMRLQRASLGNPHVDFFHPVFPPSVRLDALHPNKLGEILEQSGFYTRARPPLLTQLLMP